MKNYTHDESIRLVTGVGSWHTSDANGKLQSALLSDGPHGLRKQEESAIGNNTSVRATCFPTSCAVAAGWDREVAADIAKGIAKEAIAEGAAVVLGPGANIKRSPLCGRNFEYYSEDPYLAGELAAGYIAAMQEEGVGTSLKHFAANNQETFRMTGNSRVDERTLREIYLSAFESAVRQSQPATIMASYNQINGTYSCENKWLLTDVLRNEWGFKGLVVSDWGACSRLSEAINAGMDLEMPDTYGNHGKLLKRDLANGKVSKEAFDRAVSLITEMSDKYARDMQILTSEERRELLDANHAVAVAAAGKCAVLLENNGILPLDSSELQNVLLVGSMAEHVRFQGGGSSHINTDNVISAMDALGRYGIECIYEAGYDDTKDTVNAAMHESAIKAAKEAAAKNLPIIFCGGLTDFSEGEGYDRRSFDMPSNQAQLLKELTDISDKVIFLAFGGSPFNLEPADKCAALLMMYLGGEGVMEAAADIISGKVCPSGKLPETFPLNIEDTPCYGHFATASRNADYRERMFVGYRYYDTYDKPVKYPFGYGLSYTSFEYSNLQIEPLSNETADDNYNKPMAKVTLTVKNTGTVEGSEIVQIYAANPRNGICRAARELRAFEKITLMPGQEQTVSVILNERAFSIYDVKAGQYAVVPGVYGIQAASSLQDVRLSAEYTISEEKYAMPYGPELDYDEWVKDIRDLDDIGPGAFTVQNSLVQMAPYSLLAKIMLQVAKVSIYRMLKGKPKDDPEVMMFYETACEGTIDGVVNGAGGKVPYRIAEAIILGANGHKLRALGKLITG